MKEEYCTKKGDNSKFFFVRIMSLFGLRIFSDFLNTPNITKHTYLELINSNVTRDQ